MSDSNETIHGVSYASQPYVNFDCDSETRHFVWAGTPALAEGVYRSDGGLYTFDEEKVTCPACRANKASTPIWRVGKTLGRTLYKNEELVGLLDTPELAAEVVQAMNKEAVTQEAAVVELVQAIDDEVEKRVQEIERWAQANRITGNIDGAAHWDKIAKTMRELYTKAETAEKNYRFMVEKAADEKLDGYRELGQRAARAENALDRVKGDSAFVQKELQEQLTRFVDDVRDVMDSMDPDSAACKELCEALRKLKGAV